MATRRKKRSDAGKKRGKRNVFIAMEERCTGDYAPVSDDLHGSLQAARECCANYGDTEMAVLEVTLVALHKEERSFKAVAPTNIMIAD